MAWHRATGVMPVVSKFALSGPALRTLYIMDGFSFVLMVNTTEKFLKYRWLALSQPCYTVDIGFQLE